LPRDRRVVSTMLGILKSNFGIEMPRKLARRGRNLSRPSRVSSRCSPPLGFVGGSVQSHSGRLPEPPTSPRSRPTRGWCSPRATGTWSPDLLLCRQGDQRPVTAQTIDPSLAAARPSSWHRLGPFHMPLEAERCSHGMVAEIVEPPYALSVLRVLSRPPPRPVAQGGRCPL
jgi:hypothetical protein